MLQRQVWLNIPPWRFNISVSVIAPTCYGYFYIPTLLRNFVKPDCPNRNFGVGHFTFITMVPLSERSADEYADTYFKAIYCQVA